MRRTTIQIAGMQCGGCIAAIREALDRLPGTHVEEVSLGRAKVAFDPRRTDLAMIEAAIVAAGYEPAFLSVTTRALPS